MLADRIYLGSSVRRWDKCRMHAAEHPEASLTLIFLTMHRHRPARHILGHRTRSMSIIMSITRGRQANHEREKKARVIMGSRMRIMNIIAGRIKDMLIGETITTGHNLVRVGQHVMHLISFTQD